MDHLKTFFYIRNLYFIYIFYKEKNYWHFMSHLNTIISMFFITISKCKNTEKYPSKCNQTLLSKTLRKKFIYIFKKSWHILKEKTNKCPNLIVECHKMLSDNLVGSFHCSFLCIAMPPAGTTVPLFLHSIFFSPLRKHLIWQTHEFQNSC